jgi:adenylate cyclase
MALFHSSTQTSLWRRSLDWLTRAETAEMPRHVVRQIAAQRQRNEILTGWVQALLVTVFAALYVFSRKTAPTESSINPVPWALMLYAMFTVVRLMLAYRNKLSHTFLLASVVADMALLMITIWSFHVQYAQPAAFSLKAPTLLYVFIFIALRVLSIAPGYVLFSGLVAAGGWALMVTIALMGADGMNIVTRDYVAYINSARILLGGEIDKILSILLVTLVLTVATARARALLYQATFGEAAATQLSRFLSPDIAETIVHAEEALLPGQGMQTEAATMFIDMRGFTKLTAKLPPAELIALLGEYQSIAVPIIQRNNGSITTYLGDGIMVTFGAIRRSTTYAADAMRTAEDLLDALGAWAAMRDANGLPAPGVGMGIAMGIVTCGAIGEASRLEYAVIGDPVNRAAKLQNHTKAEQVRALATTAALQQAISQGYDGARVAEIRKERNVAGIEEAIDLVVIV